MRIGPRASSECARVALALAAALATTACGRLGFGTGAASDGAGTGDGNGSIDAVPRGPITFVQATSTASPATPVTTLSCSFNAQVHAGNLLLIGTSWDSTLGTTVFGTITDSMGNTYGNAVTPLVEDSYGQYFTYAVAKADGPDTITVTLAGQSATFFEILMVEESGLSPTAPLDFGAIDSQPATAIQPVSTPPFSTGANELIASYIVGHPGSVLPGATFVQRASQNADIIEDKLVTTAGSYTVDIVQDNFGEWTAETGVFH